MASANTWRCFPSCLTHAWKLPTFLMQTRRIMTQLEQTRGLIGYSLLARPLRKHFWTLSVWEDEAALRAFVEAGAHAITMRSMAPHMGATRFIRWKIRGAGIPPKWADALDRWTGQS
jgi:quinol monooxygenase YgiN